MAEPDVQDAQWVFDELPPSMARRGGDPASHVFRQNVDTFVREVVQNANDQGVESPEVHFRFIELAGDELQGFKDAIDWTSLAPHLEAAAKTKGGRNLAYFLKDFEKKGRLTLLRVEDRHTVGLTGDELEGDSHFRALCKDTLYSHKQSEGAGGSYGLGKSVLWAFSGLSTVLFNSVLSQDPKGHRSPRLFGRVELPSHARTRGKAQDWFSGPGWFGRRIEAAGGARAESVWRETAEGLASHLHFERSIATGTSLLIVGFRDPTTDTEATIEELAESIRLAAAKHFWPAVSMPGRPLTMWVASKTGGRPIGDLDLSPFAPFVECYQGRDSTKESLDAPGDVVARDIPVDIPARRDGTPAVTGYVRLCVRLAPERTADKNVGHVAWFRRPGMVIRYWDRRSLALGVRPFHAVLACGEARIPEDVTPEDVAVEQFLRAAEPPGHDDWHTTAALKAQYKRGYGKALEILKQRINETLKELVVPRPRQGAEGPDRLRKRFPIGKRGGEGSEPSVFHFGDLSAYYSEGRWHFSGTVKPALAADNWLCTIRLAEVGEDGSEAQAIPIEHLDPPAGARHATIEDGAALIEAETGTQQIRFAGLSHPLAPSGVGRGELSMEVVGRTS